MRYTGPVFKKSRRYGFSTLETGKELRRKTQAPGIHGTSRKKLSEYGVQLQEKQKVRFMYGLSEKQLRKTFEAAGKMQGIHGYNLLILLESRLDNLVYRMGFAKTRRAARQIVNHGHILVDGKKVNIPSYICRVGDVIAVRESKKTNRAVVDALEANKNMAVPSWIDYNKDKMEAKIVRTPVRDDLDFEVQESLIVELYSRN